MEIDQELAEKRSELENVETYRWKERALRATKWITGLAPIGAVALAFGTGFHYNIRGEPMPSAVDPIMAVGYFSTNILGVACLALVAAQRNAEKNMRERYIQETEQRSDALVQSYLMATLSPSYA